MMNQFQKQIFSILFAGGEAVEISRIAQALEMDEGAVLRHTANIRDELESMGIPLKILRLEDKLQLCTVEEYAGVIRGALETRRNLPLKQAALEVLAVIAYNQPVTRAFIEQVRGVDSSGVVNSLLDKELIEEAGRLELPGRPIAYKTTVNFLRCFGMASLDELPALPNTAEAVPEALETTAGFEELEFPEEE